jgi:hypothetical protein
LTPLLLQITTFENATTIRINNKHGKLQQCNKRVNSKECHTIVALLRCCQCSGAFYSHRSTLAHADIFLLLTASKPP